MYTLRVRPQNSSITNVFMCGIEDIPNGNNSPELGISVFYPKKPKGKGVQVYTNMRYFHNY